MNAIKGVMEKANVTQKEVCEKLNIKQSTLSSRMNREMKGTIEWSLELAKEFNVKSYSTAKDGYQINIKRL